MSLLRRIEQEKRTTGGQRAPQGQEMQVRRRAAPTRDAYMDLKTRIQNKLIAELDPTLDVTQTDEVRKTIEELFDNILAEEARVLSRAERQRLFEQIVSEILGLGPLEPLIADPTVTEVMVNGSKNIYVEREGKIIRTNAIFEEFLEGHTRKLLKTIIYKSESLNQANLARKHIFQFSASSRGAEDYEALAEEVLRLRIRS